MNKKLLILIPAYNVEKFIEKVLYSIPNNLLKTNKVKILIINDCSSDNTLKTIKKIKKKANGGTVVMPTVGKDSFMRVVLI